MEIFTYSEARQKLAKVLDLAEASGKVMIRRRDGRTYSLAPQEPDESPLDIPSVKADVSTKEIVEIVRRGRARA